MYQSYYWICLHFRTFNASHTLQQQLDELTDKVLERIFQLNIFKFETWEKMQMNNLFSQEDNLAAKMLSYNRANRAVAILCNHQVFA